MMDSLTANGPIVAGLLENGTGAPPVKHQRKKTMTSLYLKFFETAPDKKSRSCKFCKQTYSIATATGNLGRHLNHRHPGYDKVGDITMLPALQMAGVGWKAKSETKPTSIDFDHMNWLLLKWIVGSSLPPFTLQDEWFLNSFKFVNPLVKIWPAERYQEVIHEVSKSMQEDVKTCLEQVDSMVSISLDFWTSHEQVSFMSITCHWIDDNWSLRKVLLDVSHTPYPCAAQDICKTLVKVFKLYSIDNKILCCTHDNSPTAIHACQLLKEDLNSRWDVPSCYIPCAARTLNLVIEDGLRTAKPMISKVREFVLEMNMSIELSEDFKKMTDTSREDSWKFPIDASTRWSGNYTLLDITRKAWQSMDAVIRKHEETLTSRNILLNTAERNVLHMMHDYLQPFYKTINNICTSKVPTVGLVLFFMDHVGEMISTCKDSRHSPEMLKVVANDMFSKARNYNNQVSSIITYMAAILDPRIKSELVPDNLNFEKNLEEARSHFLRNYLTPHFPSAANIGYANGKDTSEDNGSSVSFAEEIARKRRRANMTITTDEFSQYLSDPPTPFSTDVLDWWKVNSTRYPRLSKMARNFLAIQATSIVPEELFSSKGDEIDKQRYCLPHSNTKSVLCIQSWIQSGFKMKCGSSEIDYDKLVESAVNLTASSSCTGVTVAHTNVS